MRIHRRTTLTLGELARWLNPIVSGWIQYYGRFYRTAMESPSPAHQHLPETLGWSEVSTVASSKAVHAVVG